jgi:hypothetical protein
LGAWDYGALDNDPALDVRGLWEARYDGVASIVSIVETLLDRWGDGLNYGDTVTNMQVIALCALVRNTGQPIPARLKVAGQEAINRELIDSNLSTWKDRSKRETALLTMLKDLGGRRKKPKKALEFHDSSIHYESTSSAHADLMRLAELISQERLIGLMDILLPRQEALARSARINRPHELAPSFMRALHRLMRQGISEKDSNLEDQALRERRMMLAWYVAVTSMMTPEEIDALLTRVEGRGF